MAKYYAVGMMKNEFEEDVFFPDDEGLIGMLMLFGSEEAAEKACPSLPIFRFEPSQELKEVKK